MNSLVKKWGNFFVKEGLVPEDEREIIEYGITQGFFLVWNLLIFFVICGHFQMIAPGIVFLLLFWPMRIYAGGYHAKTRMRCFITSVLMEIAVCAVIRKVSVGIVPSSLLAVTAGCIIYRLAPVDTAERRLDSGERSAFQKIVRRLLLAEGILLFVAGIMKLQLLCKLIAAALTLTALLLLLEAVRSRRKKQGRRFHWDIE